MRKIWMVVGLLAVLGAGAVSFAGDCCKPQGKCCGSGKACCVTPK